MTKEQYDGSGYLMRQQSERIAELKTERDIFRARAESMQSQRDLRFAEASQARTERNEALAELAAVRKGRDEFAAALAGINSYAATASLLPANQRTNVEQRFIETCGKTLDKVEAILTAHDAAKDAEILRLSLALTTAIQTEKLQAGGVTYTPKSRADVESAGVMAFQQAQDKVDAHGAALAKPLVEALEKESARLDWLLAKIWQNMLEPGEHPLPALGNKSARATIDAALAPYKPRSGTIEVTLEGGERAQPFPEPYPDRTGGEKD